MFVGSFFKFIFCPTIHYYLTFTPCIRSCQRSCFRWPISNQWQLNSAKYLTLNTTAVYWRSREILILNERVGVENQRKKLLTCGKSPTNFLT